MVFSLSCLISTAQNEIQDSVATELPTIIEDTLSKKEARKLKQEIKLQNAGKFFSHEVNPGRKAALYSFGVPGLGQIYNRKYWKLPIVYGALGTTIYFSVTNAQELKRYNTALNQRLRGLPDEFEGILSEAQIINSRNFYRRNFELSTVLTAVFHGLNIIDAVVDAHLFDFDISDDLSFHWSPNFLTGNNRVMPGIQLSLTFK